MGETAIICKPTPWFLIRAAAMLVMFGVFSYLFYMDGSTGYRKKNLGFHIHAAFKAAHDEFARMNSGGGLTADEWRKHAAEQVVRLPEDRSTLPADLTFPVRWPEVLHDYEKMKPLDWHRLWLDYSGERQMSSNPPEKPYDARKIQEQWVVFWICLALSAGAVFFLVRTLGRSLQADDQGVRGVNGRLVPYGDLKRLDLRKWDTKGLAFLEFEGSGGKGRIRIDGLTYGGFKKEQDEPAEQLMRRIRSRFSGEILEYVSISAEGDEGEGTDPPKLDSEDRS
jgi:hypothetical protein